MSVLPDIIEHISDTGAGSAKEAAVTDPGWDIPGIPRHDPDADGRARPGSGSPAARVPGRRSRRAAPVPARAFGPVPGTTRDTASQGTAAAAAPAASAATDSATTASETAAGETAAGETAAGETAGSAVAGSALPAGERVSGVRPGSPAEALGLLDAALDYLAHADAGSWSEGEQADCLRALAAAQSRQLAAQARVLAAFSVPGGGLASDGHRSPRIWLCWQTQATRRAAATEVGWMKRLQAHPAVAAALADGRLSASYARQVTDWTDRLRQDAREQADTELLAAAAAGADLRGLALVAEEQLRAGADPDRDVDGGFEDRQVRYGTTFEGAGRIEGDLTARCAAAVTAVLDSLSGVRGPEDDRTAGQRRHDALEEACTRLIAAGMLPQRAGQPVRIELELSLDQLAANAGGEACDALIQPIVTGKVDYDLAARLASPDYQARLCAAMAARAGEDRFGMLIEQAVALLSGPGGRAAALRATLHGGPAIPVSLPLDIPATLDTIPVHLRRAVRTRDRHCRFPGCDLPPAACDVHHLVHRKDGGRHALANLTLLCRFHHLVAIHRWGWTLTLHPDGTTTAVSPDGNRILHSHVPPTAA
jgi:Domain of unknown function (DUF222)